MLCFQQGCSGIFFPGVLLIKAGIIISWQKFNPIAASNDVLKRADQAIYAAKVAMKAERQD